MEQSTPSPVASEASEASELEHKSRQTCFHSLRRFWHSREATALVVALAIFTDMLAYGIVVPILPGKLERMGRDAKDTGLLFASYAIGLLLLTPVFGVLSDRYQTRKIPMLLGLFGLGLATILFAIATEYWQLMVARIAQGVSGGASWSIGLSMIADVYPADKLGAVMGTVLGANTLGFLVGPPIGGLAHQYWSEEAPFYIIAALAFLDLLGRLLVVPPVLSEPHSTATQTSRNARTGGMVSLLQSPFILVLCLATMAVSQVISGLEPTLPLFLRDQFHADESTIGLMFTAIVMPNIFVSALTGYLSDRFGRLWITTAGMVLLAVVTPFIALSWTYLFMTISLMLCGATSAVALTPLMPELAEYVRSHQGAGYGTIYALFNMAYSFGMLGGPIVGGYLYPLGFLLELLVFSGILGVCIPAVLIFAWKRGRKEDARMRDRDEEEAEPILSPTLEAYLQ